MESKSNKEEQIVAAINFLKENGYIVCVDLEVYTDKWIAFKQKGMNFVLHGRIIGASNFDKFFYVKCKNNEFRYPKVEDAIKIFNSKKECYEFK